MPAVVWSGSRKVNQSIQSVDCSSCHPTDSIKIRKSAMTYHTVNIFGATYVQLWATLNVFHQVLAVMSHDIDNVSSQNAGIVMYRNIKDTVRTHFAETNGAGAFLEAPLHAYYGKQCRDTVCSLPTVTVFTLNYFADHYLFN